ncbi:MAG TPA: NAD(P)/FAD-dependent oxidoreductase [Candidatus Omnitrophota bacterium]|nr:NAD(P)/FAD-dependent oxidoreductase [Candidatus Omnitrophota bacterium]
MDEFNIIVIGAGPAGMMASIRAAECSANVALVEKNASFARKLGLTGKGRCNLTNTGSQDHFFEKFGRDGEFLRDALKKFSSQRLIDFFESNGLKMKVERQGRVFPETDSSRSVIDILERTIKRRKISIFLSSPVKSILTDGIRARGVSLMDGRQLAARKVIIACGGASFPETGSTGDGFKMARELGHSIKDIFPGLVPLECEENFVKDLQGLTLKNIRIEFKAGKKRFSSDIGELLFTHFGISGPLVLDLSGAVVKEAKGQVFNVFIDSKPGLSKEELESKIARELGEKGTLAVKNYLKELTLERYAGIILKIAGIAPEKKCHQVTHGERKKIVDFLKSLPLTIKRPRPINEAMVTLGGVALKEVDPRTMESKIIKGLYFCGEVLDLAAQSGGYNLQAAFSTGYLAGESAALDLT